VIYNAVQFVMPPDWIREEYDQRRTRIEREMNTRAVNALEGLNQKSKDKTKNDSKKGEEELKRKMNAQIYKRLVKNGVKASKALKEASESTGVNLSQATVERDFRKYFESD
jgi:hypothetical protein